MNSQHFDVIVVGAGSAGVAAAVSAAEEGAKTLLVERSGQIGGTLVWQLLEHSAGFHDDKGTQVVAGIGQRIIDRLQETGGSPGHVRDDVGYTATRTPVNHVELALVESQFISASEVAFWPHSSVSDVHVENGVITSLTVSGPGGNREVSVGAVVDASGDAVVAALAGAEFQKDGTDTLQPASLLVKIGNLDYIELLRYVRENPDDFREGNIVGEASCDHLNLWGFGKLLAQGFQDGVLSWERTEMHFAGWPTRGEGVINLTRVQAPNIDDPASLGDTYLKLASQSLEVAEFFRRYMPGCEASYVAAVASRIGVRESRRVLGEYTLTGDDVIEGRQWDDVVAQGCFPIDIHDATSPGMSHTFAPKSPYHIPYRALVVAGISNLLAAGRVISSTKEANGSARITGTCFATGEAAGVGAALASAEGVAAAAVDIAKLQKTLTKRGALLGQ